jgi:pimeloyl-ACP methyl ester carboxylesterase
MYIDTEGARIWVDDQGDGEAVLLLGGLGDSAESWRAQIDAFSERYRVIAPDNRGAGRSPVPSTGVSIPAMADDAAAALRQFGIRAAHVAGFSMGGAIAQELALRHPSLVRSLVLNGTWCGPDAYYRRMVKAWIGAARAATSNRELLEAFFLWIYTRRAHEDGTVEQYISETLVSPLAQSADGFFAGARACIDWHGAGSRLGGVTVPVLVVVGEEDIACPPRLSREIVAALPQAELVVLPGEAHQPFQESPETWNALVADFWARVESAERIAA